MVVSYSEVTGYEMGQIPPSQGSSLGFDFAHLKIQASLIEGVWLVSLLVDVLHGNGRLDAAGDRDASALRSWANRISNRKQRKEGKFLVFPHAARDTVVRKQKNYQQIKKSQGSEFAAQAACTRR